MPFSCICVFTITESTITRFCGMILLLMMLFDKCCPSCFLLRRDFLPFISSRTFGICGEVRIFDDTVILAMSRNFFFICTRCRSKKGICTCDSLVSTGITQISTSRSAGRRRTGMPSCERDPRIFWKNYKKSKYCKSHFLFHKLRLTFIAEFCRAVFIPKVFVS